MDWILGFEWVFIIFLIVLLGVLMIALQHKSVIIDEFKRKSDIIKEETKLIEEKNKILEEQNVNLKELNNEKNNVISVVSHDLKAPLNRVFALSNLIYLSGDNLTKEQKGYMDKMNIVVRDGLDLIRNLLDIRAIEFKGVQMHLEIVDLKQIITSLVKTYKPYMQKKQQEIIIKTTGDNFRFKSDRQYLNRIFDNLVSNAVKFSTLRSIITIQISSQAENIIVEVEDQGPGISNEDQNKLFQKYQVLTAKPTGGESSTGLGLSITHTLIGFLQGKITHRNKGQQEWGSIFTVEFPTQLSNPDS